MRVSQSRKKVHRKKACCSACAHHRKCKGKK